MKTLSDYLSDSCPSLFIVGGFRKGILIPLGMFTVSKCACGYVFSKEYVISTLDGSGAQLCMTAGYKVFLKN